jgi:hypothetical protein
MYQTRLDGPLSLLTTVGLDGDHFCRWRQLSNSKKGLFFADQWRNFSPP